MDRSIRISVVILDGDGTISVTGCVERDMMATLDSDNEENAVRLAEQMVREAFRRANQGSGR